MADFLLDFDWFRCPQGYRVIRAGEVEPSVRDPDDMWIVPKTDERVFYRPLDKYDLLYIAYASVKTSDQLFKFIDLYGPLTRTSTRWGNSISGGLRETQLFRDILRYKEKGPRKLMSFYVSREKAAWLANGLTPPEDDLRKFNRPIGTVDLVPDFEKGLRPRIETDALRGALWWQLGQKISDIVIIRECRHCGTLFEAGRDTGRRADATFCCSEHSVRFHSRRRSRGG